jgi:hypothetical protein
MDLHRVDRGDGIAAMDDRLDQPEQGEKAQRQRQDDAFVSNAAPDAHARSSKTGPLCKHPLLTTCCQSQDRENRPERRAFNRAAEAACAPAWRRWRRAA